MFFFSYLVYLNENTSTQVPLKGSISTEHNILLDLTSKTDKVIYDNLIYSNYDCSLLNPKQAQCKQFQISNEVISSDGQALELYKFKAQNGEAFKVYQLSNGEAHIEFTLSSSKTLYRYSFTSIEQIPLFTREKGLFKTGPVEWDMTSLGQTL